MKKMNLLIIACIMVIILILLPFAFERILFCTSLFPFNVNILFSRETWFSFIGSYLGAIGTIILGLIALYQNQKYKELSDESEARFISLQEDIKELTKQSVSLIEINTRIEEVHIPLERNSQSAIAGRLSAPNGKLVNN